MRKAHTLVLTAAGMLLVLTLVSLLGAFSASAQSGFKPHSLLGASKAEVEQAALAYTQGRFRVQSTSVTFALTRRVTRQDLSNLGIDVIDLVGAPPLMLVVLKGDFIVEPLSPLGGITSWRVNSINYVFDLRAGEPTHISFGTNEEADKLVNAAIALPEAAMPTTIQPLNTTPESTAPPPTLAPVQK